MFIFGDSLFLKLQIEALQIERRMGSASYQGDSDRVYSRCLFRRKGSGDRNRVSFVNRHTPMQSVAELLESEVAGAQWFPMVGEKRHLHTRGVRRFCCQGDLLHIEHYIPGAGTIVESHCEHNVISSAPEIR